LTLTGAGAQAVIAPATCAQPVPPQQAELMASQTSPAAVQVTAPGADGPSGAQMRLPGIPTQVLPLQQSSVAVQGAPLGAQTMLRQVRTPEPSGRQWAPQHSAPSAQG